MVQTSYFSPFVVDLLSCAKYCKPYCAWSAPSITVLIASLDAAKQVQGTFGNVTLIFPVDVLTKPLPSFLFTSGLLQVIVNVCATLTHGNSVVTHAQTKRVTML